MKRVIYLLAFLAVSTTTIAGKVQIDVINNSDKKIILSDGDPSSVYYKKTMGIVPANGCDSIVLEDSKVATPKLLGKILAIKYEGLHSYTGLKHRGDHRFIVDGEAEINIEITKELEVLLSDPNGDEVANFSLKKNTGNLIQI